MSDKSYVALHAMFTYMLPTRSPPLWKKVFSNLDRDWTPDPWVTGVTPLSTRPFRLDYWLTSRCPPGSSVNWHPSAGHPAALPTLSTTIQGFEFYSPYSSYHSTCTLDNHHTQSVCDPTGSFCKTQCSSLMSMHIFIWLDLLQDISTIWTMIQSCSIWASTRL